MSTPILPNELAEIVTGLLINPSIFGELDMQSEHQEFMLEIGRIVGNYCGGYAYWVKPGNPDSNHLSNDGTPPLLMVGPDNSLPSLHQNVWAYYVSSGWEGEDVDGIEQGEPLNATQITAMRSQLQSLLIKSANKLPTPNTLLADVEIRDERIAEGIELPGEHKDTYRLVIEKTPTDHQVRFRVYSKSLDPVSSIIAQHGLTGHIGIQDGKPALSLGVSEGNLSVHVRSDVQRGLFIYHDIGSTPYYLSMPINQNEPEVSGSYYPCDSSYWLFDARSELANRAFEQHKFNHGRLIVDNDGWKIDEDHWMIPVYFVNPNDGDSLRGFFKMQFAIDSTFVLSVTDGLYDLV